MVEEKTKELEGKKETDKEVLDKKEVEPVKKKEEEKPKEVDYTPTELKAIEGGWRPRDQFEGPEEEFIGAGEFLRRGELFDKIEQRRKETAELRKTLRVMQDHFGRVREAEFNRALEILKKQKVEALKENEAERVVEIESQMDDVKDQLALTKATVEREKISTEQGEVVDPRFSAWVDKNKWYAQNPEMKEFADSIGIAYTKAHRGVDPVDVLKYVSDRVKVAYPDKFKNANRDKASTVEGGAGNRGNLDKKSGADDYEMTAEEEKVFATLHRSDPKTWTRDKYVADLKLISKR